MLKVITYNLGKSCPLLKYNFVSSVFLHRARTLCVSLFFCNITGSIVCQCLIIHYIFYEVGGKYEIDCDLNKNLACH